MKVLRVASDIYPDTPGGLGIHVHEMSKQQSKMGYDVTVVTSMTPSNKKRYEERDGYKIVRLPTPVRMLGNSFQIGLVTYLLQNRSKFDIIHAHAHLFFSTNIAALIRRTGGPPLVITNHGVYSTSASKTLQDLYFPMVGIPTLKTADAILCYTEPDKETILKFGVREDRIRVIHNGIDASLFTPAASKPEIPQVLWMGRMVKGKGLEFLIEAFRDLKNKGIVFKAVLVGKGPDREKVDQSLLQYGLKDQVRVIENVNQESAVQLYRESTVFALPSNHEGMPRTLLESMSSGTPFVCTDLPQLVDLAVGCGLTAKYGDVAGIAAGLEAYLTDRKLVEEQGMFGRQKVLDHYSWKETVAKTVGVYHELVDARTST
ncbi:MAG TPA: glycosyltransferase family 4 protein [Methanomassiliicoccales archaeon]